MKCQRRTNTSFGNPHVASREHAKRQQSHKERLSQIKSTLDTRPPAAQPHLTLYGRDYVAKKKQMTEAAFSDLKMIQSIARTMTRRQDSTERRGPVSLNADFKKQEVYRIMHDNHQLLDSIEQVSPVIRTKEMIRDHRHRQRYVINASHTMRMSGEYNADVQRIHSEDRAKFEATQRSTRSRMEAHRMRNSAGSVSLPSLTATARSDPGMRRVPSQTSHAASQRRATSSSAIGRPRGHAGRATANSSTGRANASSAGVGPSASPGDDAFASAPADHEIIYESDGAEHEANEPQGEHVGDPVAVAAEPSMNFANRSGSGSDAALPAVVAAEPSLHPANESSSSGSNAAAPVAVAAEPPLHPANPSSSSRSGAATPVAVAAEPSTHPVDQSRSSEAVAAANGSDVVKADGGITAEASSTRGSPKAAKPSPAAPPFLNETSDFEETGDLLPPKPSARRDDSVMTDSTADTSVGLLKSAPPPSVNALQPVLEAVEHSDECEEALPSSQVGEQHGLDHMDKPPSASLEAEPSDQLDKVPLQAREAAATVAEAEAPEAPQSLEKGLQPAAATTTVAEPAPAPAPAQPPTAPMPEIASKEPDRPTSPEFAEDSFESYEAPSDSKSLLAGAASAPAVEEPVPASAQPPTNSAAGNASKEPDRTVSPEFAEDSFESNGAPSDGKPPLAGAAAPGIATKEAAKDEADYSLESDKKEETEEASKDHPDSEESKEEKHESSKEEDEYEDDFDKDDLGSEEKREEKQEIVKTSDEYEDDYEDDFEKSQEKKEEKRESGKDVDEYEEDYEEDFDADDSVMSPGRASGAGGTSPEAQKPGDKFPEYEDASATFESESGG